MKKKQNYRPCQSNKGGHFVALFDDMTDSIVWKLLTANEKVLYFEIAKKLRVKYIKNILESTNEDDLSLVKKEYLELMHQTTFFKSIDHLIELGFVRVTKSRYATRECTIYGLCDVWKHYNTKNFIIKNEWKRVKNRD